ncbi:putative membrane protein [Chlamydia psittaci 84/55]|nr:putative membrane protein [Chlamydia psittaci 84/55]
MTWFWIGVFAITFVVGVVTGIMQIFPLDLIGRGFLNIQGTCLEHF